MAPSASLQSRIKAFETLSNGNDTKATISSRSVQPIPVTIPHKPVHYHQEQNMLDSDSTSPTADSLVAIPPIQPVPSPSRPSSPVALGRKSSLINFSELSSPSLRPLPINGTGSTTSSNSLSDSHSVSKYVSRAPPLPPRKPSITSLKVAPTTTPPPLPKRHASSPISTSNLKQLSAPSLLIPSDSHTYPPALSGRSTSSGFQSRHIPTSSTSSFHSVSLSSDGGDDAHDSLDGSYEAVSSTAATSPISVQHDWEHDHTLQPTPKLPSRAWQKKDTSPPPTNTFSPTTRRPAPPPPQRRTGTPNTTSVHHRSVPLPPDARKRYDALFERNLPHNARKGHAPGWRGVSVDLLTNGERPDFGNESPLVEMLDGFVVKQIWSCSKLPRSRLREIWCDCDPAGVGSLNKDAFARGMWRIDEDLSRAQQNRPRYSTPPILYTPRAPPQPPRKPNFLR